MGRYGTKPAYMKSNMLGLHDNVIWDEEKDRVAGLQDAIIKIRSFLEGDNTEPVARIERSERSWVPERFDEPWMGKPDEGLWGDVLTTGNGPRERAVEPRNISMGNRRHIDVGWIPRQDRPGYNRSPDVSGGPRGRDHDGVESWKRRETTVNLQPTTVRNVNTTRSTKRRTRPIKGRPTSVLKRSPQQGSVKRRPASTSTKKLSSKKKSMKRHLIPRKKDRPRKKK